MGPASMEELRRWVRDYTGLETVPDIDHYRPLRGPAPGPCIFTGCTEPPAWVDARGENPLCEGHFRAFRTWVEQARQSLI